MRTSSSRFTLIGLFEVGEADRVDGVDLVAEVEVRVERVHDHHELVGLRARLLGIDDEHAVEALRDVRRERRGVTVVEVEAERPGVELVGERLAGLDQPAADVLAEARHAVHLRGVDAVEVHRVRMRAAVPEADAQPVAVDAAERRPGDAAVERPGGVLDAGSDLDLLVARDEVPLAQRAPVGQLRRTRPSRSRARSGSGRSRWRRCRRRRRVQSRHARNAPRRQPTHRGPCRASRRRRWPFPLHRVARPRPPPRQATRPATRAPSVS